MCERAKSSLLKSCPSDSRGDSSFRLQSRLSDLGPSLSGLVARLAERNYGSRMPAATILKSSSGAASAERDDHALFFVRMQRLNAERSMGHSIPRTKSARFT
jgi:hypothetical protein